MPKRTKSIAFLLAYCLTLPILFSMTFDWLQAEAGYDATELTEVWGDPHIGLVVDTTASMGPELDAIAAAWQMQSESRPLSGTFHLEGFKDEATYLGNTSDPVTFYNWINAIKASGGDECLDNALAGLFDIAGNLPESLRPASDVLLFTDAAPMGKRTAYAYMANGLLERGVRVNTLSNGWCPDAPLEATALAFLTMATGGEFMLTDGANYYTDTLIILNKISASDRLVNFKGTVTPDNPMVFDFEVDRSMTSLGINDDDYWE